MHRLAVVGAGVIGLSCAWRAAAASSDAKRGHRCSESTPKSSSSSSPGHASVTGASMPPATHEAPEVGAGSRTVTRRPCWAARQAQVSPTTPAPNTSSSFVIRSTISLPAPA